jgi:Ethanolamine utilization protein EutJ (predicted chaperonin)
MSELKEIIERMDAFEEKSRKTQHTDTKEVWKLLGYIHEKLSDIVKEN